MSYRSATLGGLARARDYEHIVILPVRDHPTLVGLGTAKNDFFLLCSQTGSGTHPRLQRTLAARFGCPCLWTIQLLEQQKIHFPSLALRVLPPPSVPMSTVISSLARSYYSVLIAPGLSFPFTLACFSSGTERPRILRVLMLCIRPGIRKQNNRAKKRCMGP